jgi:hypothetical protein
VTIGGSTGGANPTEEQALQFCTMIQAGLPPSEAILYFIETDDPAEIALILRNWQRCRATKRAMAKLQSKSWQEMSLDERCKTALEQHYSQLAYVLYSNHYAEANQVEKSRLDTARQALEAKQAGTAGKGDAMSQFFDDIRSGRVKLSKPAPLLAPVGN